MWHTTNSTSNHNSILSATDAAGSLAGLRRVLGVVLGVANYINGGTSRGGAHGLK